MAASSTYIFSGHKRKLIHLRNPDGTDESTPVVKIDISGLTFNGGKVPTYLTIDWIRGTVNGDPVTLHFDANTDDLIAVLNPGFNDIDFTAYGGRTDPKSTGFTGDVKLTNVSGTEYDLTIAFRPHS